MRPTYRTYQKPKRSHRLRWTIIVIAMYFAWSLLRPLPTLVPDNELAPLQLKTPVGLLAWPGNQAAAGIVGSDILVTNGVQAAMPIASTAKMITALVILERKPLSSGQPGPTITLTEKDVAIYEDYVARSGSVVPVQAGEKITLHQALQAMMIPSSNNISDSLAIWAFGSLEDYRVAAQAYVKKHGLKSTTIGSDASGMSPTTKSNARDLVLAGKLVMEQPVLAEIVGKATTSDIPLMGEIWNTNTLLGTNNIVGIKTGNTDEAGGVFVGAAKTMVNGKPVTIVTAVVGTPDRFTALNSTPPLVRSAEANFKPVIVIKAGTVVGRYKLPWGGTLAAVATKDETYNIWNGDTVKATVRLDEIPASSKPGDTVGKIESKETAFSSARSVPVKLQDAPSTPSLWWRLTHPY